MEQGATKMHIDIMRLWRNVEQGAADIWAGSMVGAQDAGSTISTTSTSTSTTTTTVGTIYSTHGQFDSSGANQWYAHHNYLTATTSVAAMAIDESNGWLYTCGSVVLYQIKKWNLSTGALLDTFSTPNGTTSGSTGSTAAATDSSGNLYVEGNDDGSSDDLFKMNSSGTVQWSKNLGSAGVGFVGVDGSDGIYAANGITLKKYNTSGTEQWSKTLTPYSIVGMHVTSGGDVTIMGQSRGTALLRRYDSGGTQQYSTTFTGVGGAVAYDGTYYYTNEGGGTLKRRNSGGGVDWTQSSAVETTSGRTVEVYGGALYTSWNGTLSKRAISDGSVTWNGDLLVCSPSKWIQADSSGNLYTGGTQVTISP